MMGMRVAVIGASHWHLGLFLPALQELPGVTVVGVSDADESPRRVAPVRDGTLPLASLTDVAAAMDLVQEAYRIGEKGAQWVSEERAYCSS